MSTGLGAQLAGFASAASQIYSKATAALLCLCAVYLRSPPGTAQLELETRLEMPTLGAVCVF